MNFPTSIPKQHQNIHPGKESAMNPLPIFDDLNCKGGQKRLEGKVAIITGGDSGIGKAVAVAYVKEGAKVAIIYYNEDDDANTTKEYIEKIGGQCKFYKGDISDAEFCKTTVLDIKNTFGSINILINNAGVQYTNNDFATLDLNQIQKTFNVNLFGTINMTQAVLPNLTKGDSIINTTSIVAKRGHELLIDYSMTKGALATFTKSLSTQLFKNNKGIRVNAVAPGPIWTPLIPSSFNEEKVSKFGDNTQIGRPGQPVECAQAYVFLASEGASFITGETIEVNGGE